MGFSARYEFERDTEEAGDLTVRLAVVGQQEDDEEVAEPEEEGVAA